MNQVDVQAAGIEGEVLFGPISPIERPGVLNYRPYQATISVLDQNGQVITKFQSGLDGHFRISLEPGTYILRPESARSLPHAPKQTVTVSENKFKQVRITYDSGIRSMR